MALSAQLRVFLGQPFDQFLVGDLRVLHHRPHVSTKMVCGIESYQSRDRPSTFSGTLNLEAIAETIPFAARGPADDARGRMVARRGEADARRRRGGCRLD